MQYKIDRKVPTPPPVTITLTLNEEEFLALVVGYGLANTTSVKAKLRERYGREISDNFQPWEFYASLEKIIKAL